MKFIVYFLLWTIATLIFLTIFSYIFGAIAQVIVALIQYFKK